MLNDSDFSMIWGSNAPSQYEFLPENYMLGWHFVGSVPPSRTMFDAWMRNADLKMQWLYTNAFSESSLGGFLFWRLPSTAYFVGDLRQLQNGPLDVYLKCTVAGMSSADKVTDLPEDKKIGDTWEDGTVTWEIMKFASSDDTSSSIEDHNSSPTAHQDFKGATATQAGTRGMVPAPPAGAQNMALMGNGTYAYAAINLLQRGKAYAVGDYAYSPNLPSWAYLECVTAGTTAETEPALPRTINSIVTDGTASFKLYHVALQSQPVGTVRDFTVDFDPNTKWGGTWSKMDAGRVLVSAGTYTEGSDTYTYTLGDKGGEAKHQSTIEEMPVHNHSASISSVGSHAHGIRRRLGYTNDSNEVSSWGTGPAYNRLAEVPQASTEYAGGFNQTISVNNTGGNKSHENRQPYTVVNVWTRTV